jgi:hypothetical protein
MRTVFSGLTSNPMTTVFPRFGLKTGGDGFLRFGLKTGGGVFPGLGLKTGSCDLVILASTSL